MNKIQQVAIFLLMIGLEKASRVMELMDNGEIKSIVPKINKLVEVSPDMQKNVWDQFVELGYEEQMSAPEVLTVIRMLFNGSKITEQDTKRF